jgi:hypothetical protein
MASNLIVQRLISLRRRKSLRLLQQRLCQPPPNRKPRPAALRQGRALCNNLQVVCVLSVRLVR